MLCPPVAGRIPGTETGAWIVGLADRIEERCRGDRFIAIVIRRASSTGAGLKHAIVFVVKQMALKEGQVAVVGIIPFRGN